MGWSNAMKCIRIASGAFGLMLVSCSPQAAPVIEVADVANVVEITDVDPAIKRTNDGLGTDGALYAIDLLCPEADDQPTCGARAAVRAAQWLSSRPSQPRELLVNVDGPDGATGFQLKGQLPPAAELTGLTTAAALERFTWHGGSYAGKDAAARWCLANDPDLQFCQVLKADACNPLAPADLAQLCRTA